MDQFWEILKVFWNYFTWALFAEERLAMYLAEIGKSKTYIFIALVLANSFLIAIEVFVFSILLRVKFIRRMKIPGFKKDVDQIMHSDKSMSLFDLSMFAFIPHCQKWATLTYSVKIKHFRYKGYFYLIFGGILRVSFYPFAGDWLWGLIVVVLAFRFYHLGQKQINSRKWF